MKKDVPTMIELGDKVVSLDIIREKFVCDLAKCKGICCVEGESGAPLEEDEVKLLEDEYDKIKPYLREEGIKSVEQLGTSVLDADQEMVTTLVDGKNECAYAIFDNYDCWKVCDPARVHGEMENVPVYLFVKDAIERKFGTDFYQKLQIIADGLDVKVDNEL